VTTLVSAREININNILDKNGVIYVKDERIPYTGIVKDKKNREAYKNGIPHGKWLTFYPNGNIKSIENWKEGTLNGKFVLYDEEGKKLLECNYKDGIDHGRYQLYYPNGKLQMEGQFEEGVVTGKWATYSKRGEKIGETKY
jgi:antitoxin component YwqK of YwqJK toxin-antitoxin module